MSVNHTPIPLRGMRGESNQVKNTAKREDSTTELPSKTTTDIREKPVSTTTTPRYIRPLKRSWRLVTPAKVSPLQLEKLLKNLAILAPKEQKFLPSLDDLTLRHPVPETHAIESNQGFWGQLSVVKKTNEQQVEEGVGKKRVEIEKVVDEKFREKLGQGLGNRVEEKVDGRVEQKVSERFKIEDNDKGHGDTGDQVRKEGEIDEDNDGENNEKESGEADNVEEVDNDKKE